MSRDRQQVLSELVVCSKCRKVISGPLIRRGDRYYHRTDGCVPDGSWAGWTVRKDALEGEQ